MSPRITPLFMHK